MGLRSVHHNALSRRVRSEWQHQLGGDPLYESLPESRSRFLKSRYWARMRKLEVGFRRWPFFAPSGAVKSGRVLFRQLVKFI